MRSEALHGNIWPEIFGRAWEGSLVKTAILAMYLRRLKASGWLDTVDHWIAISEGMSRRSLKSDGAGWGEYFHQDRFFKFDLASISKSSGCGQADISLRGFGASSPKC